MTELDIRPTGTSVENIKAHLSLFAACFPEATIFNQEYLRWLYIDNPAGEVVGFDAWDNTTLAATYVCIPCWVMRKGAKVKMLLSLNTATHENYRGQGLFTRLANATYEEAKAAGISAVYGVANANSIGGFTRKLGFTDLGSLNVRVGSSAAPAASNSRAPSTLDFCRFWDRELLNWRTKNPSNPLRIVNTAVGVEVLGSSSYLFVKPSAVLPRTYFTNFLGSQRKNLLDRLSSKVSLSVVPDGNFSGVHLELPKRFRPSPLRLIYRDLQNPDGTISMHNVNLTFLDFDAF